MRAFCTETSNPKTGASCCRKTPSTTPFGSTTAIVTCALLPSGWRIAARVMLACCAACEMIVFTSAAVKAVAPNVLPMNGKKRVSTSPAMPPTTAGVNCDGCAARMGKDGSIAPGSAPKAMVGGAGALVIFKYASRIPLTRMLSPRINEGASKPLVAETAITSSKG